MQISYEGSLVPGAAIMTWKSARFPGLIEGVFALKRHASIPCGGTIHVDDTQHGYSGSAVVVEIVCHMNADGEAGELSLYRFLGGKVEAECTSS